MSDNLLAPDCSLPPSLAALVDRVCTAFEAAWKTCESDLTQAAVPRIEDYLGDTPPPDRPALLRELLAVELAHRRRSGQPPTLEEYQGRFPDHGELVAGVFRCGVPTRLERNQPAEMPTRDPPTEAPTDWPSIPNYEILARLDTGGMGVIYKARHLRFGVTLALKMIRTGRAATGEDLARFHVEARAIAALHHPHIVRIYDYGEHQGLPYFSMEFVEGPSLARQLAEQPLEPAAAARLVEMLARAMHYVHQQGIVHRDLKPANILLSPDGTPRIADFGLAKRLNADPGLTVTGAILGTACYMAPEQARGEKAIGPGVDIYALGAILYQTLTGQPPFQAETWELTRRQVIDNDPLPPSKRCATVPRDLDTICMKCLDKEPAHRYASAESLAEDLRRSMAGEPISVVRIGERERLARCARRAGYHILDELGRGGPQVVFKAWQTSLDRAVTLKMMVASGSAGAEHRERFRREAEVIASLQHPNLVQVYDFGERDGIQYIAEELVTGPSLERVIAAGLQLPQDAARLVETLARALHYVHGRGIIHGNLKPRAVVMTTLGIPKLVRFDPAQLIGKESAGLVQAVHVTGTLHYLAPEQLAEQPGRIGAPADVYGLGGILYELLTGHPAISPNADALKQMESVMTRIPIAPSRLRREVPPALDAICLKCLQKDPGQRYPTAQALAEDLQAFPFPSQRRRAH
jgi:serine/threonine protein kinase